MKRGTGLDALEAVPWPPLPKELDAVRKDLLARMWTFAAEHRDILFNPYGTVALAPYGPGVGIDRGTVAAPVTWPLTMRLAAERYPVGAPLTASAAKADSKGRLLHGYTKARLRGPQVS